VSKVLVPPSTESSATQIAGQHVTERADWFRDRAPSGKVDHV